MSPGTMPDGQQPGVPALRAEPTCGGCDPGTKGRRDGPRLDPLTYCQPRPHRRSPVHQPGPPGPPIQELLTERPLHAHALLELQVTEKAPCSLPWRLVI